MKILVVVREKAEAGEIKKMLQRIVPISEMEQNDCDGCCCKIVGTAGDGQTGCEMVRREWTGWRCWRKYEEITGM